MMAAGKDGRSKVSDGEKTPKGEKTYKISGKPSVGGEGARN